MIKSKAILKAKAIAQHMAKGWFFPIELYESSCPPNAGLCIKYGAEPNYMGSDHYTWQPKVSVCYTYDGQYVYEYDFLNPKGYGHIAKEANHQLYNAMDTGDTAKHAFVAVANAMEYSDDENTCRNCGTEIRHSKTMCQFCAIEQMA